MSDTAIFIAATADDLKANSGLPGDVNVLRNFTDSDERVVHTELIVDSPVPGGFLNTLNQNGVWVTLLPRSGDADASVLAGLMTRLQEFAQTYPQVDRYILAGIETSRLSPVAASLQRAGHSVLLCGPDRGKLDAARHDTDDTEVWSKDGGNSGRGSRDGRDNRDNRDRGRDNSRSADKEKDTQDPFEVLVEEVSKSRKRGHRVLLTSLKQRMRKRIRRFDETRLKDKDGRPMRKFKDFVVDAANRGLIQLIEKGNASHVLLPGEKVEADEDEDDSRGARRDDSDDNDDEDDDTDGVDPLLDSVDTVEGDEEDNNGNDDNGDGEEEEETEDVLTPDDIDVDELDESANPPPPEFMKVLETLLEKPKTLPELVEALVKKQEKGDLEMKTATLRKHLQHAFNNELLEAAGDDKPVKFLLVDDWQDIIDYL